MGEREGQGMASERVTKLAAIWVETGSLGAVRLIFALAWNDSPAPREASELAPIGTGFRPGYSAFVLSCRPASPS